MKTRSPILLSLPVFTLFILLLSPLLMADGVLIKAGANRSVQGQEVTAIAPSGVLELRHEAGYVAKFAVTWLEPTIINGQRIPMPKVWHSGDVTLGWNHTLYFPPGSKSITVASDGYVFIGTTKKVFSKVYQNPPNKCLKIYGTVFALSHGECAPGDFTEYVSKGTAFFKKQAKLIEAVAEHLKQRGGNIDKAIASIVQGNHSEAARQIDIVGLVNKLRQRRLIASNEYGQGAHGGEFLKVSSRGLFNPQSMTISVNGNIAGLTGGSHSQGIAFSIQNVQQAQYPAAYVQSWAWQVCCGIGASVGLSVGLWSDQPYDLSGVGMGIGGSLGDIGGVSVVGWWQYPKVGGDVLGLEVSADFTTPSADMAYFRGWTCAVADGKNKCTNLTGGR